MADDFDVAILRTLQALQGDATSTKFCSADAIGARAMLPRWAVASHLTHLTVAGYVHADPQWATKPRYQLAPRGRARLRRTHPEHDK
jgi:hypothetical protein